MKKFLITAFTLVAVFVTQAQEAPKADSLKEYLGKYVFPEGTVVSEVTVSIEEKIFTIGSAMGSSELKRTGKDVYEVVAFNAIATFTRNADGKVIGIKIEVSDMVLEGTKEEPKPKSGLVNKQIE